jgi:1-deoxy-D-xylulose-5-phosphate synthase
LGVVELTTVLHKVYDFPKDKIIWDVGHQSYIHKILSGRKDGFDVLRKMGGLSGFPKTSESDYDCFNTGHSSTAISAALGMARARDIKGEYYSVIALVGDGALTGGMSYEAMNDAGRSPNNLTVILNDNDMSISKNVGALSRHLNRLRTRPAYFLLRDDINKSLRRIPIIGIKLATAISNLKSRIKYALLPGVIFEELGFKYIGPVDGHNTGALISIFEGVSRMKGPVLVHVKTKKGYGYPFAEKNPQEYHGVGPFEPETGDGEQPEGMTYSLAFGNKLEKLASADKKIVAITAAMKSGTGLDGFAAAFPDRFFDVGIAEQHAVTMAAGMAAAGVKPVVAVYSSFLQRAYDQILHDVCMQNLHVVFAIDRAGVVGEDGETHQGIYDIAFLRHMPRMTIMAPSDYVELTKMMKAALYSVNGPVAIRYPRGSVDPDVNKLMRRQRLITNLSSKVAEVTYGRSERIQEGTDITILTAGVMLETAVIAANTVRQFGI